MKKYVMLGVWMMAVTLLIAQPRSKDVHQHSGRNGDKMKAELSLDDEQYARIKQINEKYAGRHLVVRRDSTMERGQQLTEIKALKVEREKEIDVVLTPEQKTKWAAFKEARAEKKKVRMKERQTKNAARLKDALSLTDDQEVKMKAAGKIFKEKADEVREKDNLTTEKKHTEIRKLKTHHEQTVKGILTEEQFKKWNEFKAEHRVKHRSKRR